MAKIEGIRIKNFRGLKDVILGKLSDDSKSEPLTPMTVVIGKNGVGKSTLFDAFGFLADALKFGVEEACDLRGRGGFEKIRSQGIQEPIEFIVNYREKQNIDSINYLISIDIDNSGRVFVAKEIIYQYSEKVFIGILLLMDGIGYVLEKDKKTKRFELHDASNKLQSVGYAIEEFRASKKTSKHLDEFLVFLNEVEKVGNAELVNLIDNRKLGIATLGALKQHPEISAFRQFIEGWYLSYFTPDAVRSLPLAGAHQHLSRNCDNSANVVQFMEREHREAFQDILNRIAEKIPGIYKIDTQKTLDGRLLLRFNEKGFHDPFYAPQMSDGTLKVLAYLLLLEDTNPPPFICIEEPENGLYHNLLETLAAEFRAHANRENSSQFFITTHQPYFINGFNPIEVWILEKGEDGFSTIRRASDDDLVNNLVEEELPLGGLWYSGYLDKRSKPCTLKS
jgi:predicted ATPase